MKFAEILKSRMTPEWKKLYVSYDRMKMVIYEAMESIPENEETTKEIIDEYHTRFDEKFFKICEQDLTKINSFYIDKVSQGVKTLNILNSDMKALKKKVIDINSNNGREVMTLSPDNLEKFNDLKMTFSDLYFSLVLLENYQSLNCTGFRKILKKHDKVLSTVSGAQWYQTNVMNSHFVTNDDLERIICELENTYTELECGNTDKAVNGLKVSTIQREKYDVWKTFKVGLFCGVLMMLVTAIIFSCILKQHQTNAWLTVQLFRGPFFISYYLFLIAINIYGWRKYRVNYVLIFAIDPRERISDKYLHEIASVFGVLSSFCLLSFIYASRFNIPKESLPLCLIVAMSLFIFNPSNTFKDKSRFWLLKKIGRVLIAPLLSVEFVDFWLGDQMNSLVQILSDFEYTVCFYSLGIIKWTPPNEGHLRQCTDPSRLFHSIVLILPAWYRFAQCMRRYIDTKKKFPHLANALKYGTTFFVVTLSYFKALYSDQSVEAYENPYLYMLIFSRIVNSSFTLWWDLVMDWGFFGTDNYSSNHLLRDELIYPKYFHYFAIVQNILIRFSWVAAIAIIEFKIISDVPEYLVVTIIGSLEISRRFIWNFIRLENEHLNNVGRFRAVRIINSIPIKESEQTRILKMMDEKDGVTNRKRKNYATVLKSNSRKF